MPIEEEERLGLTYWETAEEMVKHLDVVTINCPLHPETEHLLDEKLADTLKGGQLAGYAGDVWFPQPPPKGHPWRDMPHRAMTPHISGTSLSA